MALSDKKKTRFAPSPTGHIHIGNLRTALFNWLLANPRSEDLGQRGILLLRIEDSDLERSQDIYITSLYEDLHWLSLDWQEGPNLDGPNGPYYQSERFEIYESYYQKLLQNGHAYPCFCTENQLLIHRKTQIAAGHPPRYSGACRHLTEAQRMEKIKSGEKPALRFQISDNETVRFDDLIQGPKVFQTEDIGDFIIKKQDDSASFMFCNAIDDALMGVTHALRGEDHLTNTPRQLLILKALGLKPPQYGHMPLILGFDGKPLSKRNGSQSIQQLRQEGYLPLAIINYLARLGHSITAPISYALADLAQVFKIENIGRAPARFDMGQLGYWQKEAVMALSDEDFGRWLEGTIAGIVPSAKQDLFIRTVRENVVIRQDVIFWAQQLFGLKLDLDETNQALLREVGKDYFIAAMQAVQKYGIDYPKVMDDIKSVTKQKGKLLFMPLRIALTGVTQGPELLKVFELLGQSGLLQRLQAASDLI